MSSTDELAPLEALVPATGAVAGADAARVLRRDTARAERRRVARDAQLFLWRSPGFFRGLDAVLAAGCATLGFAGSPAFRFGERLAQHADPILAVGAFTLCFVLSGQICGLYDRPLYRGARSAFLSAALTAALAWACTLLLFYALAYASVGRWVVGIGGATATIAVALPRLWLARDARRRPRRVLLLGDASGEAIVRAMAARSPGAPLETIRLAAGPERPSPERIVATCRERGADAVVLQPGVMPGSLELVRCVEAGIPVTDLTSFLEEHFEKVPVELIDAGWVLSANIRVTRPLRAAATRAFDLAFSSAMLVASSPVMALIALGIRLDDGGPVLFSQERVGRRGRRFQVLKFRTMRVVRDGADPGPTVDDDPRITRFGRILRRTRMDELPQFANVLRGEMSVLGPRPERPLFVEDLSRRIPYFELRHMVKPGITGWAQVRFHYATTVDEAREKLRYDLYYLKHSDLALDLAILLRTIRALVSGAR